VGRIEKQRDAFSLVVTKSKEINEIIIPYFKKHPFYGLMRLLSLNGVT